PQKAGREINVLKRPPGRVAASNNSPFSMSHPPAMASSSDTMRKIGSRQRTDFAHAWLHSLRFLQARSIEMLLIEPNLTELPLRHWSSVRYGLNSGQNPDI